MMKKLVVFLLLFSSAMSSMAIGFPVHNTYVHQRIEQARSQHAGKNKPLADDMIVGVVTPDLDREPVAMQPRSLSFIQTMGAWVVQLLTNFVS